MRLTTPDARNHFFRACRLLPAIALLFGAAAINAAPTPQQHAAATDNPSTQQPAAAHSSRSTQQPATEPPVVTGSRSAAQQPAQSADTANATAPIPAGSPANATAANAANAADAFLAERTRAFLANYIGVWEGTSRVQTADGSFRSSLSVLLEYRWDKNNPQVLVGTAIFATASHSAHTTSRTYLLNGRLVSAIVTNGEQKVFVGRINEAEHSVFWEPMHAIGADSSRSQETFRKTADGKLQMLMESVQTYRRGNDSALLQQQALLNRTAE